MRNTAIESALAEIGMEIVRKKEYKALSKKITAIQEELKAKHPEAKGLINDIDNLYAQMAAFEENFIYKAGYKDGMRMA